MVLSSETVLLTFAIFCRVGGCLMVMPGFSSARVSLQVRLFLALAVSLALAPLVVDSVVVKGFASSTNTLIALVATETIVGVFFGLMARSFFLALQFTATAITMYIGQGAMPGLPLEDQEPSTALSSIITMTAAALLFVSGLHLEVIRALLDSYSAVPMGFIPEAATNLDLLANVMSRAFLVALQISAPFLVYGLLVNFLFGLLNKMTPTIPAYFISIPFVIAGGLFLLYFSLPTMMMVFTSTFSDWLAKS